VVIALDIDDTITRHPTFFALLAQAVRGSGGRVVIITFRDNREWTIAQLKEWGVDFDVLHTVPVGEIVDPDHWKAEICSQEQVDVFFEDDPFVLKNLSSETIGILVTKPGCHDLAACGKSMGLRPGTTPRNLAG